jgi:predicted DNA-binding protein
MGKSGDKPRDLLSDTMKNLMPPRVELTREQYEGLKKLSAKTGEPVRDLVRRAIDRYLQDALAG